MKKSSRTPASPVSPKQNALKMYDMHIQSFSDARLAWDVQAPLGEMFTAASMMRLHKMTSTLYDEGHKSGQVQADLALFATGPGAAPLNGVTLNDGDAYLSNNVVMTSTDGTKVETDWARYSKQKDLIYSTAPVRVIRDDSITNGTGMEARSDMSDLKIFNQTLIIRGEQGAVE